MEEKGWKFKGVNENGKEIEYEVLFTFDSDETNKKYIVYTDNTFDKEGNQKVYANNYTLEDDKLQFSQIEEEKEWQVIENILASLHNKLGDKNE